MHEPMRSYPEYPVTSKSIAFMIASLALLATTGAAIYLFVQPNTTKVMIYRDDSTGMKRIERVPAPPLGMH